MEVLEKGSSCSQSHVRQDLWEKEGIYAAIDLTQDEAEGIGPPLAKRRKSLNNELHSIHQALRPDGVLWKVQSIFECVNVMLYFHLVTGSSVAEHFSTIGLDIVQFVPIARK